MYVFCGLKAFWMALEVHLKVILTILCVKRCKVRVEGSVKLCIDGSECIYVMIVFVVWDDICGVCMCFAV